MLPATRQRLSNAAASAAGAILTVCLVIAAAGTARWPQISDDVLMHYVVFLLRHGMHPYSQIVDLNLPGSYGIDWLAGRLLGASAAAWRVFDWLLMAAAGAAIIAATRSVARAADRQGSATSVRFGAAWCSGAWAAAVFALWHLGDGVAQAGQRDFILAVLLLLGYAAFFPAVRLSEHGAGHRTAALCMAAWGGCLGAAATIKPQTILLPLALLGLLWLHGDRHGLKLSRLLAAGAAGIASPLLAMALWLGVEGSLGAFWGTVRGLMVYHAGMARHSGWFLLTHALPSALLPVFAAALWLAATRPGRRGFHTAALLAGVVFGFFSFYVQGKAYPYQRYPLIACALLFAATELAPVFAAEIPSSRAPLRFGVATAVLLYGVLWLAPASTAKSLRYNWRTTPTLDALTADLSALSGSGGVSALQNQVQCMDTMAGCITVLDRMHLVQATGFLYDCYFFAPEPSPVRTALRARFLAQIQKRPPRVFVVTSQWCLNLPGGYRKLAQWPEFAQFLARNYAVAHERDWHIHATRYLATWPFGYRLYVRNNTPSPKAWNAGSHQAAP